MKEVVNGTRPTMWFVKDELYEALRGMTQEQINNLWDSIMPKLKEAKEGEAERALILVRTKKEAEHHVWDNLHKYKGDLDWDVKDLVNRITFNVTRGIKRKEKLNMPTFERVSRMQEMSRMSLIGLEGYTNSN